MGVEEAETGVKRLVAALAGFEEGEQFEGRQGWPDTDRGVGMIDKDDDLQIMETFARFGRTIYMANVVELGLAHQAKFGEYQR